jgi:hypothetical protein
MITTLILIWKEKHLILYPLNIFNPSLHKIAGKYVEAVKEVIWMGKAKIVSPRPRPKN